MVVSPAAVRSQDKRHHLPVSLEMAEHFLASMKQGEKKKAVCVRADAPPVIDGRLDDACWGSATRLPDFVDKDSGRPVSVQTQARLAWDEENLYMGIVCREPTPGRMVASERPRDGNLPRLQRLQAQGAFAEVLNWPDGLAYGPVGSSSNFP